MDEPSQRPASNSGEVLTPRRKRAGLIAGYLLLALLLANPVLDPADDFGDPSFQQSLGYFMSQNLQAGHDYIFTYGPLGHFLIPRFQPELFWLDYAVGLAMGLIAAWPIFTLLRHSAFRPVDRIMLVVPFLLAAYVGPGPETPYLMSAFVMVALVRRGIVQHSLPIAAFAAALAFLSLGKFTLLVLAVGFIGYACLYFMLKRLVVPALTIVVAYVAALFLFWVAAGQGIGNFAAFIRDSIEISQAYNVGMFLEGSLATRALGLVVLCFALTATLPFLTYQGRRIQPVLDAVFILVFLFILWKMGMVRQHGHEIKFFLPAMLLPLLVPMKESAVLRLRYAAVAFVLVTGTVGYAVAAPARPAALVTVPAAKILTGLYQTVLPLSRLHALEALWHERQVYDAWPKTARLIGDRSIDIFPPEQRVLAIGEFNYVPRYTFQGYQACTPRLLELNGGSYWGTRPTAPPEFVFYRNMPIDHRFPFMEDSQALLALFYCYSPVLLERGLVVFERNADAPASLPHVTSVASGTLDPHQTLEVPETPGEWQLLSLEFVPTESGLLPSLFSQGTAYRMAVEYADGRTAEFRVLPDMAQLPFLLNRYWPPGTPVHQNNDYQENLITSLRLLPDTPSHQNWRVNYQLSSLPPPAFPEHSQQD